MSNRTQVLHGRDILFDKITDKITLYSGLIPLTMAIEAMVEEVENAGQPTQWYVTLTITGFGSSQQVFLSETVPVTLDTVVNVPFLSPAAPMPEPGGYGLQSLENTATTVTREKANKVEVPVFSVDVLVSAPQVTGQAPGLQIVDTSIGADWVIGSIDIIITDPPVQFTRKDVVTQISAADTVESPVSQSR